MSQSGKGKGKSLSDNMDIPVPNFDKMNADIEQQMQEAIEVKDTYCKLISSGCDEVYKNLPSDSQVAKMCLKEYRQGFSHLLEQTHTLTSMSEQAKEAGRRLAEELNFDELTVEEFKSKCAAIDLSAMADLDVSKDDNFSQLCEQQDAFLASDSAPEWMFWRKQNKINEETSFDLDKNEGDGEMTEKEVTLNVKCPILQTVMVKPVRNKNCLHVYDLDGVKQFLQLDPLTLCPVTRCPSKIPLRMDDLETAYDVAAYIKKTMATNKLRK